MNYASWFIFLSDQALMWPLRESQILLSETVSPSEKQKYLSALTFIYLNFPAYIDLTH